jgi:hypothetical protein
MSSLKEMAQFLEESWYRKSGLTTAEIVSVSALTTLLASTNAGWLLWICIIPLCTLGIFIVWRYTTRPPIVPKDKVGFLVCISCTDEGELRTIVEDFIAPLRKLVKSGKAGNSFHFVEMPQHFAKQVIDADSASEMRIRCKAHFMIYGRAHRRVINGKENHIIELDGAVAHQPISDQMQKKLEAEFSELLPRNVQVSTENDLFAFQFTSEWTEIVARYVIGIAAACSGDIQYAELLYRDVLSRLHDKDQNFPIYRKLKERIPSRLAELYEAMASSCHEKWAETHDPTFLTEIDGWLDKIDPVCQDRNVALTLRAITLFLTSRSVDKAIGLLKKLRDDNNRIWQCNMAFLYAYKGNLKQAARHYRQASRCNYGQDYFYQIEDFINWILEQEPSKYQLYYCLGFINWIIKEDRILALEYFRKFRELRASTEYLQEKALAEEWVGQLSGE